MRKIINHALMTEKCMGISEAENKLIFRVDITANKNQIKEAVAKQYKVKVADVQTVITPKGIKKAFVKLDKAHNAAEIVANMGVI
jgi:large subunit ribosomal protein L23|tara:strand:- start:12187 stop:12441 length:255 start_codon:yes stop_codon:yes gene_type:complete